MKKNNTININTLIEKKQNETLTNVEELIKDNYDKMFEISILLISCFFLLLLMIFYSNHINKFNRILLNSSVLFLLCFILYKNYNYTNLIDSNINEDIGEYFSKDTIYLYHGFSIVLLFTILLVIWFIFF